MSHARQNHLLWVYSTGSIVVIIYDVSFLCFHYQNRLEVIYILTFGKFSSYYFTYKKWLKK
jgi:hypothetical protein